MAKGDKTDSAKITMFPEWMCTYFQTILSRICPSKRYKIPRAFNCKASTTQGPLIKGKLTRTFRIRFSWNRTYDVSVSTLNVCGDVMSATQARADTGTRRTDRKGGDPKGTRLLVRDWKGIGMLQTGSATDPSHGNMFLVRGFLGVLCDCQ